MKALFAALLVLSIAGILIERFGDKKYPVKRPTVSTWRCASAVEAHAGVHRRFNKHIGVVVKPPVTFEEKLALRHLRQEHAGHPQVDFSACVRSKDTARGGTSGGGEEG